MTNKGAEDMKRYYVYKHLLDNTILIDTVKKTWTFYNTNIWGQFHNLNDAKAKKVTAQRINGLVKRLSNSHYGYDNAYVVDQYIYHFFFTDEQREAANHSVDMRAELVISGDDLHEVLTFMCKDLLEKDPNSKYVDSDYYVKPLEKLAVFS